MREKEEERKKERERESKENWKQSNEHLWSSLNDIVSYDIYRSADSI